MNLEHESADEPMWDCGTGVQNLLRNRVSGRYYTRVMLGGKRMMRSLKTTTFSVAKLRHADEIVKVQRQRRNILSIQMGDASMGLLIDKLKSDYEADTSKAERSKECLRSTLVRLVEQWKKCFGSDLRTMKPSRLSLDHARRFANFLHGNARHQQNQAKRSKLGYTATTVNTTIEVLYRILRLAVETGAAPSIPFELNPVQGGPLRKPELRKKLDLPSSAQMRAIFADMRRVPDAPNLVEMRAYLAGRGAESAEFAEFMAFSGARRGEAEVFVWEDDLSDCVILRGTKTETSRDREVPKISALRDVLQRMRARREAAGRPLTGRVFTIKECREGMDAACKRVGAPRMTHHSLRHFFATICIEAGVDIPTVSRWLGHADGGVLAMQTYGHLRREHSLSAAAKVQVA